MLKLMIVLYKIHVCMRALVYNDLILAVLNECNLLFLHILLRLCLDDKSRANYMKHKTLQCVTQSTVTLLHTFITVCDLK